MLYGYIFEFDERSGRIWNAYIESIQLSGAVFRLTKRIQQEQEDIADLEVEWKERMNKFRRLTGDRQTKDVEQDPMMTDEMDLILQIRDNLEHRKLILESNLTRRMVYRKNLDNIEELDEVEFTTIEYRGEDDKTALEVGIKAEFIEKMEELIRFADSQHMTAIIGFSLDSSGILSVHARPFDPYSRQIEEEDHYIVLDSVNNIFGMAEAKPAGRNG